MPYHFFDKTDGQYLGSFEKANDSLANFTTTPPPEKRGVWFWSGVEWVADQQGPSSHTKSSEIIKQDRRGQILSELAALDRFLSRSVEDLLDAGVIQLADLSLENQARRAQKLALRDELAELEV